MEGLCTIPRSTLVLGLASYSMLAFAFRLHGQLRLTTIFARQRHWCPTDGIHVQLYCIHIYTTSRPSFHGRFRGSCQASAEARRGPLHSLRSLYQGTWAYYHYPLSSPGVACYPPSVACAMPSFKSASLLLVGLWLSQAGAIPRVVTPFSDAFIVEADPSHGPVGYRIEGLSTIAAANNH